MGRLSLTNLHISLRGKVALEEPKEREARVKHAQESVSHQYRAALRDLCEAELRSLNLIVASNRGPIEFYRDAEGKSAFRRGQGGLVTALNSMVEVVDTTWVASPMSDEDARIASDNDQEVALSLGERQIRLRFVPSTTSEYHGYYDRISNALLWFLQHGITHPPEHPEFDAETWRAWEDYVRVNERFAGAIAELCRGSSRRPLVLIHDYHLYLVPLFLRRLVPDAVILHFTHICWPCPDYWRQVPPEVRGKILESLLACDVVGFHTPRNVRNFMMSCEDLLGAQTDMGEGLLRWKDRLVRARSYPISIDPEGLRDFAESPEVQEHEEALVRGGIADTINLVQVARTDPSKNILRSFKAFAMLLDDRPDLAGKLRFWGLLPASRQSTDHYRHYLDRLKAEAEAINHRHRRNGVDPIVLYLDNSYPRAIAAMKHYDALVVNSLADGMNLVAKEGPIVNQRHGVLLLSETAGACEELRDGALCVNPYDLVGLARSYEQAISMPRLTRARMQAILHDRIEANPIYRWVHDQLADALALMRPTPRIWVSPFYRSEWPSARDR